MAIFRGSMACDSCSEAFDGDPIGLMGSINLPAGLSEAKYHELSRFWLCSDCREAYPNGPRDFFTEAYFEADVPMCAECGDEEVESVGHVCSYCDDDGLAHTD